MFDNTSYLLVSNMNPNPLFILIFLQFLNSTHGKCSNLTQFCNSISSCFECLHTHECCSFCVDEIFLGSRCDIEDNHNTCQKRLKNVPSSAKITRNWPFSDVQQENDNKINAVQLRPQNVEVNLRIDEPVNITIKYQPAKNYPLDLYYLTDLTYSMREDMNTLKILGQKLTDLLQSLTKIHRIAFGSYIDKLAMPFYPMEEDLYQNPCRVFNETCAKAYLFKHGLNFTSNITEFIDEVYNSEFSGNYDNLEGGSDALMQILLCPNELSWSKDSRKIIVLATGGMLHFAGDGLLLGATKRNRNKCLIDQNGEYLNPNLYDYPSLEEIHRELKKKKSNIIIASKNAMFSYYSQLKELLSESGFVGELADNSTNVLDLVEEGYYTFLKHVTLQLAKEVDGVEVKFFADCDRTGFNETSSCDNAQEGRSISFKVQLTLKCPNNISEVLYVEEKNLNERVRISLKYPEATCPAEFTTCIHGKLTCGECLCEENWKGPSCDTPCVQNIQACRKTEDDTISMSCFGNGDCICGSCDCRPQYTGRFCDILCPLNRNGEVCSNKGKCDIEGHCVCSSGFIGEDCSCALSEENCRAAGLTSTCTGHGTCVCNKCVCDDGYSGQLCEKGLESEGLCNVYVGCVIDNIENQKEVCIINGDSVKICNNASLREEKDDRQYCYSKHEGTNGQICEILYTYTINERNVIVDMKAECASAPLTAQFMVKTSLIIVAIIIVGGLLCILLYKLRIRRLDRREYERFMEETAQGFKSNNSNPIYKNPVVSYAVPQELVHSKFE